MSFVSMGHYDASFIHEYATNIDLLSKMLTTKKECVLESVIKHSCEKLPFKESGKIPL